MILKNEVVFLDGETLTLADIVAIGKGEKKVELDENSLKKCKESREIFGGNGFRTEDYLWCKYIFWSNVQQDYQWW